MPIGITKKSCKQFINIKKKCKMPFPILPLIPSILGAGASIFGNLFGARSQDKANQAQRAWSEKMYQTQRADALSDWKMQNEYNSPLAQMQRFRDAKLNPNLIYGQGTAAGGEAGVPRSSTVESYKHEAFRPDLTGVSSSIFAYYDVKLKEAQLNNLEAQNTVMQQEAALKAAQVLGTKATTERTGVDTATGAFQLSQMQSLKDVSLNMAKAQLEKVVADTRYTVNQDERAAAINAQTLQKGIEEILNLRMSRSVSRVEIARMQEMIKNVRSDTALKEADLELRKQGIYPGDPVWMRILVQKMDEIQGLGQKFLNPWDKPQYRGYERGRSRSDIKQRGEFPVKGRRTGKY